MSDVRYNFRVNLMFHKYWYAIILNQFESIRNFKHDIVIKIAVHNGRQWSETDRFRGPLRGSFGGQFCDQFWITFRGFYRMVLRSASIKCDPQSGSKRGHQSGPKSVIFWEPAPDYPLRLKLVNKNSRFHSWVFSVTRMKGLQQYISAQNKSTPTEKQLSVLYPVCHSKYMCQTQPTAKRIPLPVFEDCNII